jgi:xanthine dehydrogenase accessory factor
MDDWPDDAMGALKLDTRTAVVTLTHDPKIDDPALAAAMHSPAFYIGALGSRKTHASRLIRLRDQGFDSRKLDRIHGPIGLNLGGRAPAEIAVSILAEALMTLHGGSVK